MTPSNPTVREQVLNFGPFQLFRAQKTLLEHGKAVRLSSRALDILIALVERAGEVVTKNELMSYAWPHAYVEESNLRVHVAALRKMMGDGQNGLRYIVNVIGRGYSFVAPVTRSDAMAPGRDESARNFILPAPCTRVLGRSEVLQAVGQHLRRRRLVTIVGPAGVGKTTVALALGEQLLDWYGRRVCFVDLATLEDPGAVPFALATVIGIAALAEDPVASVVAALRASRILIILDNCEHVIGAAAQLVEVILRQAPDVTLLATSREPLAVQGEYLCNLEPLAHPTESTSLGIDRALAFPAIQLFVERATAGLDSFELTDANVAAVVSICRRVEGIPLAIELIAARTNLFGVELLAAGFGDNLLLLARGKRTAQTRQQSLRATLDWSYRTLLLVEQTVLRRLAIFRGSFTAESATAVTVDDAIDTPGALDALMSLVGKSLVMTDLSDGSIRYRLLHVTRVYSFEKLAESQEQLRTSRAHAEHVCGVLEGALTEWEHVTRAEWLARYGRMIDDVRGAMDWAFGIHGDLELGTALTVAALPFGFQLSLIDEFKRRAQRALDCLRETSPKRSLAEIRITNALIGLLHATGAPDEAVIATITRAAQLAEQYGDPRQLIEPYATRAILHVEAGDYVAALKAADGLQAAACQTDDALAHLAADRVRAQVHFNAGEFGRSRSLAERVLRHPAQALPLIYGQGPVNRRVSMRTTLSRILWLQGRADEAEALISEGIALADTDVPSTLCQALALAAIPIAFWRGDLDAAMRRTEDLLEYSRRYTFTRWYKLGLCYQKSLSDRVTLPGHDAGGHATAVPASTLQREILVTVTHGWLDASTMRRAQQRLCGWSTAELLRACGERMESSGERGALQKAEAHYQLALEVARQQQALGWELRVVMSLALLWRRQGRVTDSYQCLKSVYEQFTQGFGTADLVKARAILVEIETAQIA